MVWGEGRDQKIWAYLIALQGGTELEGRAFRAWSGARQRALRNGGSEQTSSSSGIKHNTRQAANHRLVSRTAVLFLSLVP